MTPEKPRHDEECANKAFELYAKDADLSRIETGEGWYKWADTAQRYDDFKAGWIAAPAALGTPEGGYFSVVSWRRKGDDLWLYHKASGNKKANLYELALVGEIEALRAERIAPALGTPEGERIAALEKENEQLRADLELEKKLDAALGASQARTIAALRAALHQARSSLSAIGRHYPDCLLEPCTCGLQGTRDEIDRALKEHPNG